MFHGKLKRTGTAFKALAPWRRCAGRGGTPPAGSFDFLGFTHYWGRSRKGRHVVRRKTASKRMTAALQRIAKWCRDHRHWKVAEQHKILCRKLRGHYAYYGITGNNRALAEFRHQAGRRWRYWLNRRSWKARMHWTRFSQLLNRYPLPPERVVQSIYRHGATV